MTLKTMKFFLFLFRVGLWKTIERHWIYNLDKMYISEFVLYQKYTSKNSPGIDFTEKSNSLLPWRS